MGKRHYSQTNHEDHDGSHATREKDSYHRSNEMTLIVSACIRTIFSREAKNQKIRRETLQGSVLAFTSRVGLKACLQNINEDLESVFGLRLNYATNEYNIVSSLSESSRDALLRLWQSDAEDDRSEGDMAELKISPDDVSKCTSQARQELVVGGITILIVALVVLSDNRLREQELIGHLEFFGLSGSLNHKIPGLNQSLHSFLDYLLKKEYLSRASNPTSSEQSSHQEFTLGKRTLREIDPSDVVAFLKTLSDSEQFREQAQNSVLRCFP